MFQWQNIRECRLKEEVTRRPVWLGNDAMLFFPRVHGYLCSPCTHPQKSVWLETLVAFGGLCVALALLF